MTSCRARTTRQAAVHIALVALLAVVLMVSTSGSATASPTSVSVSAGALGVTSPAVNDFAVVVLDGTVKVAHAPLASFSVTDARGSGHGWTLSMQATPFREWDGTAYVPEGKSLPVGSLTLGGVAATAAGTDSEPPTIMVGPFQLDGPSVMLAAAAAGTGMGTFVFDPTTGLSVAVPASAYAHAYRSELSISVASGP